ncbi:MAG: response regulator [Deltaproteobacteria bacterium]|nr:response regulator [Deltaproteobacteria bacterium]
MKPTLGLRAKAILFLIPVVAVISTVHTFEAIRTERSILRAELLKRGETIAAIAARNAELAILSGNPELLKRAAAPLQGIRDVSFVGFYDARGGALFRNGDDEGPGPPGGPSSAGPMTVRESPRTLEFTVPVFTVTPGAEFDLFDNAPDARSLARHIGWARVGVSQEVHRRAAAALLRKGALLGLLSCAAGVGLVFAVITLATRPLHSLIAAVKGLREGEHVELAAAPSRDEFGQLSEEFRRMSAAIRDREARIRASENRLRALFDRVEHAIFRLDPAGAILEGNRRFEELFPCPATFESLFPHGPGDRLARALRGELRDTEETIRGRDSADHTVMISVYPDRDEDGVVRGLDGYLVDVTEKKKLEEALAQTQKLESLGLLAGGIAHDFNNILTGILGYSQMLQEDFRDGEAVVRQATIIEKSALRAAGLTQQLLGFARKGKLKIEPLDVNHIASELVLFVRETFDRAIAVSLDEDHDLPPVLGDGTQVYQALLNLCINARDAMPGGGALSVRTALCRLDAPVAHDLFTIPAGEYAEITVADTGTGMTPEVRRRVFEPFYTTKGVGKGTGLGMSMAYGIAKNHGGYITLDSEVGRGTVIRLVLPIVRSPVAAEEPVAAADAGAPSAATVLLIDDEEVVRNLTKKALETRSYRVLCAENGTEGVRLYCDAAGTIDLVILDMVMPEMNGATAFSEIRAVDPEARILLCSGYDEEEYFNDLFEKGAVGFVQKPFRFAELFRKVEAALSVGPGGTG